MNIVFVGGEFRNKGCEAMIISTATTLERLLPSPKFTIISRYSEDVNEDLGDEFEVIWDYARNVRSRSFLILLALLIRIIPLNSFRRFAANRNSMLRSFFKSDVVIDISGLALTDDIGLRRILVYCSGIFLCKLVGIPFVVYPQSMGPFNSILSRTLVRIFLPMSDLIMVRGETTKKSLEKIGINTKEIHSCADSAFLFEPASSERAVEILRNHGVNGKPLVGIVPNIRIYDRCNGIGSENTYVILLTGIIDYIIDEFDTKLVLIPFEFKKTGIDDRLIINEILRKITNRKKVFVINKQYDAAELKAIIGQLDLLLASRFHSIVASTSMLVPVVVIGWADKYAELMEHFGLEEYVVDYREATSNKLKFLLKKIWFDKDEIVRKLKTGVPQIEKSAMKAAELVTKLLCHP